MRKLLAFVLTGQFGYFLKLQCYFCYIYKIFWKDSKANCFPQFMAMVLSLVVISIDSGLLIQATYAECFSKRAMGATSPLMLLGHC